VMTDKLQHCLSFNMHCNGMISSETPINKAWTIVYHDSKSNLGIQPLLYDCYRLVISVRDLLLSFTNSTVFLRVEI
jgi:hypothetical protein